MDSLIVILGRPLGNQPSNCISIASLGMKGYHLQSDSQNVVEIPLHAKF